MNTIFLNWIAFVLLCIGGLNWGLVGIFNFNLVDFICGGYNAFSIIIYCLVLASTLWLLLSLCLNKSIYLSNKSNER